MRRDPIIVVAALSAVLAIMAGAFGAHAAQGRAVDLLRTGAGYQLIHAVAAIVIAPLDRWCAVLLLAGAAVFALSLYALALGGPRWLGAITPLGGLAMIAGWLFLAYRAR